MDPIYIVSALMRDDKGKNITINNQKKTWQDFIGYSYEKYYYKALQENQYTCQHTLKQRNGEETDLLVIDKNKIPVLIECKTFRNPHSLEDYISQLDKMYSTGYLIKDSHHIKHFKQLGINNPKNQVFKGKLNGLKNWEKSYGIFLSNIIFPANYLDSWYRKTKLFFLYEVDFYKLINNLRFDSMNLLNYNFTKTWINTQNYQVTGKWALLTVNDESKDKILYSIKNKKLKPEYCIVVPLPLAHLAPFASNILYLLNASIGPLKMTKTGLNKDNIRKIFKIMPSLNLELVENKNPLMIFNEYNADYCIIKLKEEVANIEIISWKSKSYKELLNLQFKYDND